MQINQKISDRQFFIKHEKSHVEPILATFDLITSKQYSSQKKSLQSISSLYVGVTSCKKKITHQFFIKLEKP